MHGQRLKKTDAGHVAVPEGEVIEAARPPAGPSILGCVARPRPLDNGVLTLKPNLAPFINGNSCCIPQPSLQRLGGRKSNFLSAMRPEPYIRRQGIV